MLTGMLGVKSNTPEQLLKAMNMLGMGTTITGDIKTEGDIRIDGKVIGKVSINSKLAVGESGIIEGDVQCKNASIEGRIKGNLHISELVFLRKCVQAIFTCFISSGYFVVFINPEHDEFDVE